MLVLAQKKKTDSPYTVLTHVNVIDLTGSPVQSDMTVVINGNRIITLSKTSQAKFPGNAFVINASGKYLIPGLWDMHVHIFNNISQTPPDENDFSLYIANGVTGIREMWTKIDEMPQINLWRKQFFEQPGTIPRFGAVGTLVDGSSSKLRNSDTVSTEAEARLMVQRIKAAGIDFVKVYDRLSRETYFAIADEARKQHIPFEGHVPYHILLKEAVDAGQYSIEHLTGSRIVFNDFDEDCSTFVDETIKELPDSIAAGSPSVPFMKQALELCDENKALVLFQYLAEKCIWECPTLVLYKRFATDSVELFNDPRLKYISLPDRQIWKNNTGAHLKDVSPKILERALTQIAIMKKAGVQFLAGTDVDNDYLYPGFSLHDELALFVDAGFTPMEALQTATINPARFLGTTDSLGTIEKGKIADMVLLDANPLTDIRNTKLINSVFVNGKFLPKEALHKMLMQVEKEANKNKR